MTVDQLLQESVGLGIRLSVTAKDKLRVDAPVGVMTQGLRTEFEAQRDELVFRYLERAAIMEFDGGLPRMDAESLAQTALLPAHLGREPVEGMAGNGRI